MLGVTTDESHVDSDLVPDYYDPSAHHSLWVKITDFEQVEPSEITDGYVLVSSGEPVTIGGLGNQTPLIIRRQSSTIPGRYFILNQAQSNQPYDDSEGERYHWTVKSSGATKQLANSPGAHFVYYRPGEATDGTSRSYFGWGRVSHDITMEQRDGVEHYIARLEDFERFAHAVSFADGPPRNAQTSISRLRGLARIVTRLQRVRPERGVGDVLLCGRRVSVAWMSAKRLASRRN